MIEVPVAALLVGKNGRQEPDSDLAPGPGGGGFNLGDGDVKIDELSRVEEKARGVRDRGRGDGHLIAGGIAVIRGPVRA